MTNRPDTFSIPPDTPPHVAFAAGAVYGAAVQKFRDGHDPQPNATLADVMRAIATGESIEDIARTAYQTWGDNAPKENHTDGP